MGTAGLFRGGEHPLLNNLVLKAFGKSIESDFEGTNILRYYRHVASSVWNKACIIDGLFNLFRLFRIKQIPP